MTAYTFLVTLWFQVINAYVGTVDTGPVYIPMKFNSDLKIESGTHVSFLGKQCGKVSSVVNNQLTLELETPCKQMIGKKSFGYLAYKGGEESETVIELSNPDYDSPLAPNDSIQGYTSVLEYWNS